MLRLRLQSPRAIAFLLGVVAFLLGGAIALIAFTDFGRGAPPRQQHANLTDMRANPIGPGAQMTSGLPSDTSVFPFAPLLPTSDDGSTDVKTAWARVDVEPALAVELQSGVLIMERLAEAIDFPTDAYYKQLGEGVPGGSIDEINGAPALVIQSTTDLGNPSSVDTILQGVHISIVGAVGQDVSELVALARTIPATGAGGPIHLGNS